MVIFSNLCYFFPQFSDAFLDGLLHWDRLAEHAYTCRVLCNIIPAAANPGSGCSSIQCALRLAAGLRKRMRRTEGSILRPVTSRNIRSTGVSRCGFLGMNPPKADDKSYSSRARRTKRDSPAVLNLSQVLQRRSRGIFVLARVLDKLGAKVLLCVPNSLHGFHGNLKLKIARSADRDCRDCATPFEHPKIAFLHALFSHRLDTDVSFIAQTLTVHPSTLDLASTICYDQPPVSRFHQFRESAHTCERLVYAAARRIRLPRIQEAVLQSEKRAAVRH